MASELNSFLDSLPFRLESKISEGFAGTIYKAFDPTLQRPVAVKIIPCNEASAPHLLETATKLASLDHPGIATVYGVTQANGLASIATEWVEGTALTDYLLDAHYDLSERLLIARQIASALAAVHQLGVLRRTLKPSDVVIDGLQQVRLVDFGMTSSLMDDLQTSLTEQQLDAVSSLDLAQSSSLHDAACWVAPELLRGDTLTAAADVFNFGILLYQLCYQQHPYRGKDLIATTTALTEGLVRPIPNGVQKRVPAKVQRIIRQCLSLHPEQRPASMQQLVDQLDGCLGKLNKKQGRFSDRYCRVVAGAVLLLSVGSVWFWSDSSPNSHSPVAGSVLAVMPFQVLSDEAELVTLGRGLGFHLNHQLAIPGQKGRPRWVIPPSELRRYQDLSVEQLQQYFAAEYVLMANIEPVGGGLQMTLALLDGKNGQQLRNIELALSASDWAGNAEQLQQATFAVLDMPSLALTGQSTQEQQAFPLYLQGLDYIYRDAVITNVQQGIETLEQAIQLAPDFVEAKMALVRASLWIAQRDTVQWVERAEQVLATLQQGSGMDSRLLVLNGQIAMLQSNYSQAISLFQQVLQLDPAQTEAHFGLANTYRRQGELQLAEQAYLIALEEHHSWFVLHYLATFYLRTGQSDKAEQSYRQLSEWTPENVAVWEVLGAIQFSRANYSEAFYAFQRALLLSPVASNYSNVATALFYQRKYEEAVEAFQDAVELDPKNYLLWANLADSYRHNQQPVQAKKAYRQAIVLLRERLELAPNHTLLRLRLAVYLAKSGHCDVSEQIMQALDDLVENRQKVLAAHQAVACGNHDEARQWLQQALDSGYSLLSLLNEPEFSGLQL
ncbi:protein kinase [Alkalimonas sp. MEB108]|uniref:Protein kinase n=1 Tax=Alkalimonas cellulosilytica TaxID=3058395 RepID=A0ABU7JA67_9GAMM|nr:protein kinase [Alkalimonas sp. MEB108]MEE2003105.1 protein kinase [Alkalimonas sp. MEB108]